MYHIQDAKMRFLGRFVKAFSAPRVMNPDFFTFWKRNIGGKGTSLYFYGDEV